jgi:hypothetical protein
MSFMRLVRLQSKGQVVLRISAYGQYITVRPRTTAGRSINSYTALNGRLQRLLYRQMIFASTWSDAAEIGRTHHIDCLSAPFEVIP